MGGSIPVESEPLGEYLSLVVRFQANHDGGWYLTSIVWTRR